jgi:hypothetical protein
MGHLKTKLTIIAAALAVVAGNAVNAHAQGQAGTARNDPGSWRSLSDLSNWRGYDSTALPRGWSSADGVIAKTRPVNDLVSKDEFGNFELAFDWKLAKGGNSGVFYHGTTKYDHIYWSGPEYQLLDDANAPDGKEALTSAAAAYAVYAPVRGVTKPADEWNAARIVVNGAHVEHWLNGRKVVDYELWSPDWKAKVAASKFMDYPDYGMAKRGHIGIQGDHDGSLAIRNIRIRELP